MHTGTPSAPGLLAKKYTANFQLMVNSNRGRITYPGNLFDFDIQSLIVCLCTN